MKMPLTIVGAGAVGTALACEFHRAGFPINAVYSRTLAHARLLARKTHTKEYAALQDGVKKISGIVFITVPDDSIKETVRQLIALQQQWKDVTVFHTSGALSSSELFALKKKGASIGSFHPLQTFPGNGKVATLEHVRVCLEGNAAAVKAGRSLALAIGAVPFILQPQQKILYHIAAVFSSNYLVTLLSAVEELGKNFGLQEEETLQLFQPLIDATLTNVRRMGAGEALTGPIARWDVNTIRKHTDALSKKKFNNILALYASLGLATARLASQQQGVEKQRKS